jgi:hypothetical protein
MQAALTCAAPPAPMYDSELRGGTRAALAAAALAGLPPNDDTVHLARVAAMAGKTLDEVVRWSHGGATDGNYTATALHSRGRGRVQAAGGGGGGSAALYVEMGSWTDPEAVEMQLAAAAERHKRGLTGEELRRAKQRKREQKEQKARAWLLD